MFIFAKLFPMQYLSYRLSSSGTFSAVSVAQQGGRPLSVAHPPPNHSDQTVRIQRRCVASLWPRFPSRWLRRRAVYADNTATKALGINKLHPARMQSSCTQTVRRCASQSVLFLTTAGKSNDASAQVQEWIFNAFECARARVLEQST